MKKDKYDVGTVKNIEKIEKKHTKQKEKLAVISELLWRKLWNSKSYFEIAKKVKIIISNFRSVKLIIFQYLSFITFVVLENGLAQSESDMLPTLRILGNGLLRNKL